MSEFLERAGADACKPEDLGEGFGVIENLYFLSERQAQRILDMQLQRLTGMEHQKLLKEYEQKVEEIREYMEILGNPNQLVKVIREELEKIENEFGDERRSIIQESKHDLSMEDLIMEEDRVVTLSHGGYAKSQPLSDYQAQRRGGMGKSATQVKDEDFVEHLLIANTHDTILCFTDAGKVFWLKVYQIPVAGRQSRGRPMVNLLSLDESERITSILPVTNYDEEHFIFMATANGTVKKTLLTHFSRPRNSGLRAIELEEGDHLVGTAITDGNKDIMLFSSEGKAVRFKESDVRSMGRISRGVRGIKLGESHKVISMVIPESGGAVLTVSTNGFGKRTSVEEFPTKGRATQGVIGMQTTERNGPLVAAVQVFEGNEIMLISNQGTLVRTRVAEISLLGRNTQGVRVIRLKEGEFLVGVESIEEESDENTADSEES